MDVTVTGVPKPTGPTILSPFLSSTSAHGFVLLHFSGKLRPRLGWHTAFPGGTSQPFVPLLMSSLPLYPALSPHFPYGTAGVCHDSQEFLTVPKLTLLGWDRKAGCS